MFRFQIIREMNELKLLLLVKTTIFYIKSNFKFVNGFTTEENFEAKRRHLYFLCICYMFCFIKKKKRFHFIFAKRFALSIKISFNV